MELIGQDGWGGDARDLSFGDWVQSSTEELHWQLLLEAQASLKAGELAQALLVLERALRVPGATFR